MVVIKVTRMTQTPYALPRLVVYRYTVTSASERNIGIGRGWGRTLVKATVTTTVPTMRNQFASGM